MKSLQKFDRVDVNDNVYAYKDSLVAPAIVCVFGFGCKAITLALAGSRVQKCFDFVRRTNCRKECHCRTLGNSFPKKFGRLLLRHSGRGALAESFSLASAQL